MLWSGIFIKKPLSIVDAYVNGNKFGIGWQRNFPITTKHSNVKTLYDESIMRSFFL